ncbi:MAG TPA: exodeoxyribonuclease VII small subunit [Candidatus Rikenella faecigallinarum]|uniref:Exodeoxyribonuclease VII small subunit n=1 Tax=Candidatus Rikenella faecigallinarum TaxID=2838745 RepID=A0A9D1QB98_9BACT|nr:exodeoxyribonuclease VII small subunit [Candidatus Rikenella faecigallinarum]
MAKTNTTESITYAQAVAEIEDILEKMNDAELDIDQLGAYVERATTLITLCKEKLLKAQKQVEKVMKSDEA